MLVFCASVTVFAEGENTLGSITLNGTTAGKTYRIYRIFDLQYVAGDPVRVSYTISEKWADFFNSEAGAKYLPDECPEGATLDQITVDGKTKYINITEANVADFAKDALVYAAPLDGDAEMTAAGTTLAFTELALGYYLVYPVGATGILEGHTSICSLTNTVPDAEAVIKAKYPPFDKTAEPKVQGPVQVGDNVEFTLTGEMPDTTGYTTYVYRFKDLLSDGLQLNGNSFAITVGETALGEAYFTLDQTPTETTSFTVTFDILKMMTDNVAAIGQEIKVVYTAKVLESAVTKVEENKAWLEFSNDPGDDSKTELTTEKIVKVYSAKIVIDKFDGADKTSLPDAQFVLYKTEGDGISYYHWNNETKEVEWVSDAEKDILTTDADGKAVFSGLAEGTYYLKEVAAPNGYNLLPDPVEVSVPKAATTDAEGIPVELAPVSVTAPVENNTGSVLPGTGGIGTTIFYVLGSVLALGAVVLLITKKRMSISK